MLLCGLAGWKRADHVQSLPSSHPHNKELGEKVRYMY